MEQTVDVIGKIKKSQKAKYNRGKSWEYCYVFFRSHEKFRNDKKLLDHAALHLGFFLASWGMLRGSSFLLQKDYKFYIPIVEILVNSKYNRLWGVNFLEESKEQDIDLLFKLKEELEKKIKENNINDGDNDEHELDLIITKTIMATMGCVPGYDEYFKNGVKIEFEKNYSFNQKSFENLLDLVCANKIKNIYKQTIYIPKTNIEYPPMKLLDLHFWLLGRGRVVNKF